MEDIIPEELSTIKLSKQLTKLQLLSLPIALKTKLWVGYSLDIQRITLAELENIGTNHLGFVKFLFQQYSQQLRLNSNHYPAESAFNFYVNDKITECLEETVNIKAARENFYTELFQHTNLPRNYSFAPIIREINQTIEKYTQQQFPITYTDKGKGKLQTPAVILKEIQLPTWKKQRIESSPYLLYHHTPGSTINILLAGASTPNATLTFEQIPFQSKQKKKQHSKNNFKVATTPDTTTLEYYQSIYTHCKQRFNIPDGIEVVKKSVYQYIKNRINNYLFGNYNISELGTEDLNSETLATYFYELNFNIIKYCEKTYPVQSQYTMDFELETETSNKGKNKLKQYSRTIPNTPTLPKTTAKHLQTPEQGTTENQSEHSETAANKENDSEITEEESIDKWLDQVTKAGDANGWNAARMLRTIPYFLKETAGEWFKNLAAPFNDWNTFKAAFLKQFTDNNTSITLCNCFQNIKQEPSESIMTYIGKFNKLLRQICQLETKNYYSDAQILDQFIAGLKDKLIKKVRPHVPEDLNSAIQHVKRYEMAIEEANCTKLVNLAIGETSSAAKEKIDQLTKKQYQQPLTQHYQVPAQRLITQNQFTPQNRYQVNNNRISSNNQLVPQSSTQPRSNHYHTQFSYLTIPKEQDFHYTAPLEGRAAAQQQNPSYILTTIPPARIAENANLSDIFPFEFEANKSPFLLSNTAANKQKAITTIYTEAEVKGKTIRLILDSRSAESIITYQLMQQLKRNVDQPAQTVIITADGMKKTPVGEINNFPFTLDGITIPVKVLCNEYTPVPSFSNANLNWETQELTISYQGQHARVPATCGTFNKCSEKAPAFEFKPEEEKPLIETFMALGSMSNWADETEQEHFTPHFEPKTSGWNILYSKPEPRKQCPYIPLKCKDCHKKLLSIEACISPEEEYENHTCYYCKTCHRER
ncbi:hypothetical protein G9A89_010126 [Geosiphon pyriformis]|nr:hypothetical protein G9A89_010126 [Geosiphon pyriformis]